LEEMLHYGTRKIQPFLCSFTLSLSKINMQQENPPRKKNPSIYIKRSANSSRKKNIITELLHEKVIAEMANSSL
jgi:hypothetical protein